MKTYLNPLLWNVYKIKILSFYSLILILLVPFRAHAGEVAFTPLLTGEFRAFPQAPKYTEQNSGVQSSATLGGKARWSSDDRKQRVKAEARLKLDAWDKERTNFDVREATYSYKEENLDLTLGVDQVFWGVAESTNIVDVINQFDTLEDIDQEEKLGQPIVTLGKFTENGRYEFIYMPYFREKPFPGKHGRQRTGVLVDTDAAEYERSGEEFAGDFAVRYENQLEEYDLGIHAFYGTAREPFLKLNDTNDRLIPVYQKLLQAGIDIQKTKDAWLWKFEGVLAHAGDHTYISNVAGFEYTFFNIKETGIDIGALLEILYDSRDMNKTAATIFENDLFIGMRITPNDAKETEFLIGSIIDVQNGSMYGSVEYERRLEESLFLEAEAKFFIASESNDPLYQINRDSNFTLRLTHYF